LFDQRVFTYLEALKPSIRGEFELTDALLPYIENGELCAAEMKGWINVEHPWDLLDANRCVLNRTGSVYGENTEIMPGCTIESPCYIGSDCVIGPNAYIRRYTSIGNNCRIGNAVEIKNSIIMDGTKIPHFSYVGDSVIGRNCNIGAGAMIANLRHDDATVIAHFLYRPGVSTGKRKFGTVMGDNVKIGINCPIMPGMMIESGRKIVLNTKDLTVL
jgi:bifunctional UDP-N-acetylglucosamine pyrophosphorylase/glucosamine-1-phosphate N-acetyltransferase